MRQRDNFDLQQSNLFWILALSTNLVLKTVPKGQYLQVSLCSTKNWSCLELPNIFRQVKAKIFVEFCRF